MASLITRKADAVRVLCPDGWQWEGDEDAYHPGLTSEYAVDSRTGLYENPRRRIQMWTWGTLRLKPQTSHAKYAEAYENLAKVFRDYYVQARPHSNQRGNGIKWMQLINVRPRSEAELTKRMADLHLPDMDASHKHAIENTTNYSWINVYGWTMPDGTEIAPGAHMLNGNPIACSTCMCVYTRLAADPATGILYCRSCVRHCPGDGILRCDEAVFDGNFRGCEKHFPRATCSACSTVIEAQQMREHRGKPYCPTCIETLCQRCNVPGAIKRGISPLVDGRERYYVCESCQQSVIDWLGQSREEKLVLEKPCSLYMAPHADRPVRLASIELELTSGAKKILADLFINNLTSSDEMYQHWQGDDTDFCYMEYDGSLPEGGGELIFSKIRMDDKESAKKLSKALTIVRKHIKAGDASVDLQTGAHIHIDAHKMGFDHIRNLVLLFNYLEDPIYRLAAANYTRHRGIHFAMVLPKQNIDTQADFNRHFFRANQHHSVLNVAYFYNAVGSRCQCGNVVKGKPDECNCQLGKCTVEFRVFNGTTSWRKLQAYMAICQSMVAYARAVGDVDVKQFQPCLYNAVGVVDASLKKEWVERIAWMYENLYFTAEERESIDYCLLNSTLSALPIADRKRLRVVQYQGHRYAPKPAKDEGEVVNPYEFVGARHRGQGQTTRSEDNGVVPPFDTDGTPALRRVPRTSALNSRPVRTFR